MQVTVNGVRQEIPAETNILELLAQLNVQPERVAVEINLQVIHRQQYNRVPLKEGDQIEIIGFVGGGSLCR
ncbi:MAG: sulfur carrier protein ThiS [Nitrospirae bacterium]|nr:sulfur carrier protein ThiS [Candidatus Manganitrophaceae bacterium]